MVLNVEGLDLSDFRQGQYTFWLGPTPVVIKAADARQAISGPGRNDPVVVAAKLTEFAQKAITSFMLIAALPSDDPDRTTDPDRWPVMYWANADEESVITDGGIPTFLASGPNTQIKIYWTGSQFNVTQERVSWP